MASRVAPRTADSMATWPVASGPRWDKDRSIAVTRRRAASGDVRLEKATVPQIPHISRISGGWQLGAVVTEGRIQRPDQIFRSRRMLARVSKNLPEKLNGAPKKDGRSYRLHGEEKKVTR